MPSNDLDRLLDFLQDEVEGEERILLASQSFDQSKKSSFSNSRRESNEKFQTRVSSATDLLASNLNKKKLCIFCTEEHNSWNCKKASKLTLHEKQSAVEKAKETTKRKARAIIDSGSQRSYSLKVTAEEMNYKVRRREKRGSHFEELRDYNIHLAEDLDGPIEIRIGADIAGKLIIGNHFQLKNGITAIETKLSWIVIERANSENTSLLITSMLTTSAFITDLWTLDSLGIRPI
ncbi:hypothetical protein HNY73_001943 [Argiope bruennichi]|uniref:Peptidase aspartic putative domain-containing protein n=1 Tax=Argiope bruennichi TaxID=94029 RepID=A0A8T0FYI8_ARGBR|nr:hypothetical protein HNY73_001943 [Argiope bruennichi]